MPFSAKSLDFLFENSLNDSKVWYNEHKEDYKSLITEPFAEFIAAMQPTMNKIDGEILCDVKKLSRIYRDARYAKGKSIFRDDVWYSFCRPKNPERPRPEFFFDISPECFTYGVGFYMAGANIMDVMRTLVLADDKSYKKAQKAFEKQTVFEMGGDLYKKNHYPEEDEVKCNWLNRKSVYFVCTSKDFNLLFSDALAEKIAQDFAAAAPLYDFLTLCADIAFQPKAE